MLLRLHMSPYAYAYRTCKHPCAYAYVCVVRVNQALKPSSGECSDTFIMTYLQSSFKVSFSLDRFVFKCPPHSILAILSQR